MKKEEVSKFFSFDVTSNVTRVWKRASKQRELEGLARACGILIIRGAFAPERYSLSKS